jgi:hypothetical protein
VLDWKTIDLLMDRGPLQTLSSVFLFSEKIS